MPAEVRDSGSGEDAEDLRIAPGECTHEPQLAPRRRQRRVVVAVDGGGPLERHHRRRLLAEQEMRLGGGGGRVVRALLAAARCVECGARELASRVRLAGDEAEGRGVDGGVVATRAGVDRAIPIAGAQCLGAPPVERGVQREVLRDARSECGDVLLLLGERK